MKKNVLQLAARAAIATASFCLLMGGTTYLRAACNHDADAAAPNNGGAGYDCNGDICNIQANPVCQMQSDGCYCYFNYSAGSACKSGAANSNNCENKVLHHCYDYNKWDDCDKGQFLGFYCHFRYGC